MQFGDILQSTSPVRKAIPCSYGTGIVYTRSRLCSQRELLLSAGIIQPGAEASISLHPISSRAYLTDQLHRCQWSLLFLDCLLWDTIKAAEQGLSGPSLIAVGWEKNRNCHRKESIKKIFGKRLNKKMERQNKLHTQTGRSIKKRETFIFRVFI